MSIVQTPSFADHAPSALEFMTVTPQVITGVLLWVARSHFSDSKNIVSSAIRDFVYTPTQDTGITIESATRWDPRQVESRPAIYIKRDVWQNRHGYVSIDNRYQSRVPEAGSPDSGDRYEAIVQGRHTMVCVARTGAEAEDLGSEVFFRLLEFTPVIRKDFNFHKFTVDELGQSAKLEESSEHWAVPVSVSYTIAHGWLIRMLGPYMKSVSVNTQVDC